ncbi:hypothetical protein M405DRAFT_808682 [Rhizopogon salebrosus TDB-379]|nr:hypothetical protein M405DRAFT_808682 [Rhizopogon salebrosus TDB-379]
MRSYARRKRHVQWIYSHHQSFKTIRRVIPDLAASSYLPIYQQLVYPRATSPSPSLDHESTIDLDVSSLMNASLTYANVLSAVPSMLTDDPVARQQCVDELGIKG